MCDEELCFRTYSLNRDYFESIDLDFVHLSTNEIKISEELDLAILLINALLLSS